MIRLVSLALAVVALAFAGCGGDVETARERARGVEQLNNLRQLAMARILAIQENPEQQVPALAVIAVEEELPADILDGVETTPHWFDPAAPLNARVLHHREAMNGQYAAAFADGTARLVDPGDL